MGQATKREALKASADPSPPLYNPGMVDCLPEVARRYFSRPIEPGMPLHRVVRLEMDGTFVLNGTPDTDARATDPRGHVPRGMVA
jgi:hypothetical protein